MKRVLLLAVVMLTVGWAGRCMAETLDKDTSLQVYYHLQFFAAPWRSEDEPRILLVDSLEVLAVAAGLRLLRRVWRRGVVA